MHQTRMLEGAVVRTEPLPIVTGMSMVPLADIFNHKAALVALAGGYSIEQVAVTDESIFSCAIAAAVTASACC